MNKRRNQRKEREAHKLPLNTLCPCSYFFLFQKNLGVTNLQYGELLHLLHWLRPQSEGIIEKREAIVLWEGYVRDSQQEDGTLDYQLLSSLEQSLKNLFIIEPFYTCCVVHSPWE